jgi:hypothetical protein
MNRKLRDIPELVNTLKGLQERFWDKIVPQGRMKAVVEDGKVVLRVAMNGDSGVYGIADQVHPQLCSKEFKVGARYYKRLQAEAPELLCTNLNHWLSEAQEVNRLVRFDGTDLRAFLSDRYRPLDNLDILTQAVRVIQGLDGNEGQEKPWARGAVCFGWTMSPTHMNVLLANPKMVVDLNHIERGVQTGTFDLSAWKDGDHEWLRPEINGNGGGSHLVCPSARVKNSETGHGGLAVFGGGLESVCANTAWMGKNFAQVHLGKTLQESDVDSEGTIRKMNELIYSRVADAVRAVFDPASFLALCEKFVGLKKEALSDVKDAVSRIVKIPGMTEDLRDDILASYRPMDERAPTTFDLQRAVTHAAHAVRENDSEKAFALEELGGKMIERGLAAIPR